MFSMTSIIHAGAVGMKPIIPMTECFDICHLNICALGSPQVLSVYATFTQNLDLFSKSVFKTMFIELT